MYIKWSSDDEVDCTPEIRADSTAAKRLRVEEWLGVAPSDRVEGTENVIRFNS